MKSINAFSLTANVNQWVESSRQPRILHVFDRAFNLINERGDVLSIVTVEIGDGPFNLVIEDSISFSDQIHIESSVSCSQHSMIIDNITIHTADAKLWNPQPEWDILHYQRNDIASHLDIFQHSHHELLIPQSQVSSLTSSVADGDIPLASLLASKLAGLGIGLTPTGDDIILGALYAAWVIHPREVVQPLASEIAEIAAPLTTSLSAAWLKAAGSGEAGILWHELFAALVSANDPQIHAGMKKILATGATSGADALAGFIGTLHAHMESQRKHVLP